MPSIRRYTLTAFLLTASFTLPAHAVSKEIIQLQTQVQQLLDAVARLQQSNDERMGVLKDLVQQTADSVNKMSITVGSLQQQVGAQQEASTAKSDQVSGQIQSLNDSLDELKARMVKLDRRLQNIDSQQQAANTLLQSLPGSGQATAQPAPGNGNDAPPLASQPSAASARNPPAPSGPAPDDMYRGALGDYMAGKYPLAASEFADLIKQYPDDNLSGNAYFYLGEINNRTQKPSIAIKDYDLLLERYPDNSKIPAAHLHKGEALIAMKQTDAGVRELRALIQRFPNSPESAQARNRLSAMRISSVPRR
ncbi:MAG: tetratricopeptide repeat protein [Acidobacteriaceae bacterium]